MANKIVTLEETKDNVTEKKVVQVENKVLEVPSDTSLIADSTNTIDTEIIDGTISSELKKGSVSTDYLSSDLQEKIGKETLPLKKLFLRPKQSFSQSDRITRTKLLKGTYDISGFSLSDSFSFFISFTSGGGEYIAIDISSTTIEYIKSDGSKTLAYDEMWNNEDYKVINVTYDTDISNISDSNYNNYISKFLPLWNANDIVILNRDKIGYNYTPLLFRMRRRNHTHNYGGNFFAKSILSRQKHCGWYPFHNYEIPTRESNMTLFDLLEWLGILAEGHSDELWYKTDEVRVYKKYGDAENSLPFKVTASKPKGRSEIYFAIPLRSSDAPQDSNILAKWSIANSFVLGAYNDEQDYTSNKFKWFLHINKTIDNIIYYNFFVRMGVGMVQEQKSDKGNWLRYMVQDINRVSVRMQFDEQPKSDINGDYIGKMIISFKGEISK